MPQTLSLDQLEDFLKDKIREIEAVEREVEEIQTSFNSAYQEFKDNHDATLNELSRRIAEQPELAGPELWAKIEERLPEEQRLIEERRAKLRDELIPAAQEAADGLLAEAQKEQRRLRELNPELDKEEESLKKQKAAWQKELAELNAEVARRSRGLGFLFHFISIAGLDRRRQRVIGKLEALEPQLRLVREKWEKARQEYAEAQENLQQQWREASLKVARLREELAYLDDEASREALALRRAAFHTIDALKTPVSGVAAEVAGDVERMIELNIQTDDYQESLGKVAGFIALLGGVRRGMENVRRSVQSLIREQNMHSTYLPKLKVFLADTVQQFHEQWAGLGQQLRDEAKVAAHPRDFIVFSDGLMATDLSSETIEAMFQSLGGSLQQATVRWKG